jgi:hypothetical protein
MIQSLPDVEPLDGVSKLRDKIAKVICAVDHNGNTQPACDPVCSWCAMQADLIIETVRNHEGKS